MSTYFPSTETLFIVDMFSHLCTKLLQMHIWLSCLATYVCIAQPTTSFLLTAVGSQNNAAEIKIPSELGSGLGCEPGIKMSALIWALVLDASL